MIMFSYVLLNQILHYLDLLNQDPTREYSKASVTVKTKEFKIENRNLLSFIIYFPLLVSSFKGDQKAILQYSKSPGDTPSLYNTPLTNHPLSSLTSTSFTSGVSILSSIN